MKIAFNCGWGDAERELIEVELLRDGSTTLKQLDGFGFTTDTGRKVNRLQLRQDAAPKESPWREKFFEKMPRIQEQ